MKNFIYDTITYGVMILAALHVNDPTGWGNVAGAVLWTTASIGALNGTAFLVMSGETTKKTKDMRRKFWAEKGVDYTGFRLDWRRFLAAFLIGIVAYHGREVMTTLYILAVVGTETYVAACKRQWREENESQ